MWILWKRGPKIVNFVKNETFEKCEFCEKWYFQIVNFVKNKTFNMWIFGQNEDFRIKVEFLSQCEKSTSYFQNNRNW